MLKPDIAYEYKETLYLNITNRCPTICSFCIKKKWKMLYRGYNLNLNSNEPSIEEILKAIVENFNNKVYPEIVFCGYGEPTMRFDILKETAKAIKNGNIKNVNPYTKVRINTNGLGNLINHKNIIPEIKGLIDSLTISLNTIHREQWLKIMSPLPEYKNKGFESVIEFIKQAKAEIPEVTITTIRMKEIDTEKVREFAQKLNVKFRLRALLDNES